MRCNICCAILLDTSLFTFSRVYSFGVFFHLHTGRFYIFSLPHTSLTEGPWESLEKDWGPTAKKVCLSLFRDPWDGREGGFSKEAVEEQGCRVGFIYFPYPDPGHSSETWALVLKKTGVPQAR
jgi:hypothetical protein